MTPIPRTGYIKTFESKIIRTKHMIRFRMGETKRSLVAMMADVPDGARIDEVVETDEQGIASIEFHEERADADFLTAQPKVQP